MTITIETWPLSRSGPLATVWSASVEAAPFSYSVTPHEFSKKIVPVESDDESLASSRSQTLIVALERSRPVGFAHLCACEVEIDNEGVECGVIRYLAFLPDAVDAGRVLLEKAEEIFVSEGRAHADAFPLFHGYSFHNHKIGILSKRIEHVTGLLASHGYNPHDGHLTMERPIDTPPLPDPRPDIDVNVERTIGKDNRPNLWVKATTKGQTVGNVRTISGPFYASDESLNTVAYTRWVDVAASYRRRGIARHLLRRALHEMHKEGYTMARLNCREKNLPAVALYASEGYVTRDVSHAYVKDLGVDDNTSNS